MTTLAAIYLLVVIALSLASFVAYGVDKHQARRSGRRISEQSLHLMAFFGGWPGALLAQQTFRHKTQKLAFRVVFWGLVVLHVALVGVAAFALSGMSAAG